MLTVSGIDALLEDFGLGTEEKANLLRLLSESIARRRAVSDGYLRALKRQYRAVRERMEMALAGTDPQARAFAQRSARNAGIVLALQAAERDGRLCRGIKDIVGTLVHMHVNRMLLEPRWTQELVLGWYMSLAYSSQLARSSSGRKELVA